MLICYTSRLHFPRWGTEPGNINFVYHEKKRSTCQLISVRKIFGKSLGFKNVAGERDDVMHETIWHNSRHFARLLLTFRLLLWTGSRNRYGIHVMQVLWETKTLHMFHLYIQGTHMTIDIIKDSLLYIN